MPDLIRHPDIVPPEVGNQFNDWIPRSNRGMTTFLETIILWTDSDYLVIEILVIDDYLELACLPRAGEFGYWSFL